MLGRKHFGFKAFSFVINFLFFFKEALLFYFTKHVKVTGRLILYGLFYFH